MTTAVDSAFLAQVVARAHQATGRGILYKLGKGGYDPAADYPGSSFLRLLPPGRVIGCDCSGFVAWCLGVSRDPGRRKDKLWPKWFETTNIWTDANGPRVRFDSVPLQQLRPGDLVVYPDHKDAAGNHREGHMAVVIDPVQHAIIDCSSSQSKKLHQAITVRDGGFFWRNIATLGVRWKR